MKKTYRLTGEPQEAVEAYLTKVDYNAKKNNNSIFYVELLDSDVVSIHSAFDSSVYGHIYGIALLTALATGLIFNWWDFVAYSSIILTGIFFLILYVSSPAFLIAIIKKNLKKLGVKKCKIAQI
jgi:hypothetical protein